MRHTAALIAATAAATLTAFAPVAQAAPSAQAALIDACESAVESFPDASDVWDAIGGNPDLSTFAELAAAADDVVTADGPITVLAPTNAAFDAIPPNVLDAILADADLLTTLVGYHVLPGASSTPDDLAAGGSTSSATGDDVTFEEDGYDVIVNGQALACGYASSGNGTVVVIDNVLVPPTGDAVNGASSLPASSVPADSALALTGEEADVANAFETAVDSSLTYEDQAPFIEDAETIRATIENYPTAADAVLGITANVTGVEIDGDTATITYTLSFNGVEAPYGELDGTVVRLDGEWVVPLEEYCAFQARARNACPA
jgi:uncharacterized surface protein with fasciclin (FAS1) repeats